MFPANEMMFAAEIDYRRERLLATAPRRRSRRRERHVRVPRQRRSTPPDPAGPALARGRGAGSAAGETPAWRRAA